MLNKILILDFGSQYTQLIARRIREAGVFCEIKACDCDDQEIIDYSPKGIILSGGPESVFEPDAPKIPDAVFELNCPVLGICYGMHALALKLGGQVAASEKRQFGRQAIILREESILFGHLVESYNGDKNPLDVWMSHGDKVTQLPEGFNIIAESQNAPICAMADEMRQYYALQFHPEVTHSVLGQAMLERFVLDICQCEADWTPAHIVDTLVAELQQQIGHDKVLLGLSGGVDSSVVAALLHKAIGDQLMCVFVDTGLLRLNEREQVITTFQDHFGVNLIHIDAKALFFEALKGESDPEKKRKIIGENFVRVFESEAKKHPEMKWLAQGTIYPDVIESAGLSSKKAHVIKSHHNVGGLPEHMDLKLCEPLRLLFKDEVRKIGQELGLSKQMVSRHPFPGPGLGVRILGEIKPQYVDMLQKADAIFIECLHEFDYYNKTAQAFAVFLPVKSVGVMGDQRRYEYVIALRAVETTDFMTAHWAHLPYTLLEKVSSRIINEVSGIARVTYDISSKPPATIEWE
tara:strand:- start:125020 stop:126579 length:1560 start_codon:yes stop_codon:yes gene_type:complete